jgi:hypothetical protein
MLNDLSMPVALVAHDAGAANHLLAWLAACEQPIELRPCLAGPALALWQKAGRGPVMTLEQALEGAATVLSGTGWASDLEHAARIGARDRGLHSIAVIDHWTNYPARFERAGVVVLPDELWVADAEAAALARTSFPGVPVRQQPNLYLAAQVAEVHALEGGGKSRAADGRTHVLYLLEPIRDAWGALAEPGEFAALDYFMARLDAVQPHPAGGLAAAGPGAASVIRLRPHPSDPPGKYDAWLARHGAHDIGLDPHAGLAQALAWSDTVAGCQTYAMVVALAAGRRVISTVPPWAPPCVLPQPGIVRLSVVPPHAAEPPHA